MRIRAWMMVLAIACAPSGFAFAQPRPMTLVDLISVPRLSDPSISPDGRQIAFVRSDADWGLNKRVTHIWRTASDGTGLQQLTWGVNGESSPRWSPDGASLAFVAKRGADEEEQLYVLPTGGGEARRLTSHATAVSDPTWSPDGTSIYFLASDPKSEAEAQREKTKDDMYAFDENYQQRHLWKVGATTGVETRVTTGDFSVWSYAPSRDGSRMVTQRGPSPRYGDNDRTEVWIMDASGANARAAHRQPRHRGKRGALPRQPVGRVCGRRLGRVRALLQRQAVPRPRRGRPGAHAHGRRRVRGREPLVVEGWQEPVFHRQHWCPQPGVPGRGLRRHAHADHAG